MKSTENLSQGISEELSKKIELFLINNIEHQSHQEAIVSLLNETFLAGAEAAFSKVEALEDEKKAEIKKTIGGRFDNFMENFQDKLNG